MTNLPPKTWHYKTIQTKQQINHTKVMIIGGMHGNEPMGIKIIQQLKKDLKNTEIKNGELTLMIGNPVAAELNIRPIKNDLNRYFGESHKSKENTDSYEEKRATEIKSMLKKVDILIDIHSTNSPSPAFIYCEASKKHLNLAKEFTTEIIVSPDKNFRPPEFNSSADNYIDRNGGIGITYETGHKDSNNFSEVYENIINILNKLKIISTTTNNKHKNTLKKKHLIIYDHIVADNNFKFSKKFKNFDQVTSGTEIATENSKPIITNKECYIIFPKQNIVPNKAACYLAHQIN